ncbi:MAG: hypothetical protein NWQ15_01645 [Flavobacterium sp.]|nr:hypothetical protein [Flavobacterium sp.]
MKLFIPFIFLFLLNGSTLAQQNSFSFTQNGLSAFVKEDFEHINKKVLYELTLRWLRLHSQKNKIYIKSTKENEMICLEDIKPKILCDKYLEDLNCYDVKSTVLISFFDNSYKLEVIKMELYLPTENKWVNFSLESDQQNKYFKKNGSIHTRYIMYPSTISSIFNSFNENLKKYIVNSM